MSTVKLIRGDTWQRTWVISDAEGSFVDFTGASARLHVRNHADVIVMQASTFDGRIVLQSSSGRIDLVVPKEATVIPVGKYLFDLEVTFSNGVRKTYEQSFLVILADVTHD